jgi:hypothetical protein
MPRETIYRNERANFMGLRKNSMRPLQKSKMKPSRILGSIVAAIALTSIFITPAFADRYEGGLGIERQKVERPQGGQVERRQERREERHSDRQHDRRMERIERHEEHRHMDRHERHRDHRVYRTPVWRGDIQYFDRYDYPRWRGGVWQHTRHQGRLGWWWVVGGGSWYFYSQPVYPYPDPYIPSDYFYSQPEYTDPGFYFPPVVIMQPESVESTQDVEVATPSVDLYWYYCESINGYYPYITSCPEGWRAVPASPPSAR